MKNLIKKMVMVMIILLGIEFVIFLAAFGMKESLGVLIGGGGAFINLYSLWYDIERSKKTGRLRRGYGGRYAFSAALMLVGGLISVRALIGVFVGLMNLKMGAYIAGLGGKER